MIDTIRPIELRVAQMRLLEARSVARMVERQVTALVVTLGALLADGSRGDLEIRDLRAAIAKMESIDKDLERASDLILGMIRGE